jgi:hypothetical protein
MFSFVYLPDLSLSRIIGPAMTLPKDTVGCLTTGSLGEGLSSAIPSTQLLPVADGPWENDESQPIARSLALAACTATPRCLFFTCSLQAGHLGFDHLYPRKGLPMIRSDACLTTTFPWAGISNLPMRASLTSI